MTDSAAALDQRHGIADLARVVPGEGGLPKVQVTTPAARGEIYLNGGQVTSWVPAGQADVLFVSAASRWEAGRPIRGGIPVCFPWFGNRADDASAPAHGFVRSTVWSLESIDRTTSGIAVTVATSSNDETRARWPFDFRLTLRATFGAALHVDLTTVNTGGAPVTIEEALHTYYAVGDLTGLRITGLDGTRYLDKVEHFRERRQVGDITIAAETDRVFLDTTAAVAILDPGLGRRITIDKRSSRATVVWNPWIDKARAMADLRDDDWTRMVCVETCNVQPAGIVVPPGQQHTMGMTVSVSPTSHGARRWL
jgi:glucose-6-phosphate 1-epimerase